MDKKQISEMFNKIATLLELKGENAFRCNAYYSAARALDIYEGSLEDIIQKKVKLKGIGDSMIEKIEEAMKTGAIDHLHKLEQEIPPGLLDMIRIPGFGPKKAKAVYDQLGIDSIAELEKAARERKLADLKGFGEKTESKILEGIEFIQKYKERFHIDEAKTVADTILEAIAKHPHVIRACVAGSLRRHRETIKDIDILVSTNHSKEVMDFYVSLPEVASVIGHGETKSSIRLHNGMAADLRAVSDSQFPFALMYFTGSKEHNVALRGRAIKLGFKLNEYGLFHEPGEKPTACKTEEDVFKKLGLPFIPPELRENVGELEAADKNTLPNLVTDADIKGALHMHTPASDGKSNISEYIELARSHGWEYIGVADHSQYARYANGLAREQVLEQWKEIDAINSKAKDFHVFKGIEADILPDGSVDYDDALLSQFDFVVASIHSKFTMNEKEMTRRIIQAMENPYVTILGHPTGRLLLAREPYMVNMGEVIEAAASLGVMIELNAHPWRLDMDWRMIKSAIDKGVLIPICPDAHEVNGLLDVYYGVGIARKGWCEARHIPNTYSTAAIRDLFHRRRKNKTP